MIDEYLRPTFYKYDKNVWNFQICSRFTFVDWSFVLDWVSLVEDPLPKDELLWNITWSREYDSIYSDNWFSSSRHYLLNLILRLKIRSSLCISGPISCPEPTSYGCFSFITLPKLKQRKWDLKFLSV